MNEKADTADQRSLIEKKVGTLPTAAGVYQFKDEKGNVLYVGKARNLRRRVRQYFTGTASDTRFFIHTIRKNTVDVETITTRTEAEALILENNLIKELRPRFNVRLRDDKDYMCVRLDRKRLWPRFELVRRPVKDGALTFGPYHSGSGAREMYRFLNRNFMLRTCSDRVFASRARPCLQHQIGWCMAPCTRPVDRDVYLKSIDNAVMLLEGKTDELIEGLRKSMFVLSRDMRYEEAARTRDLVTAVESLDARQRVVDIRRSDTDVIGLAREMDRIVITLMFVRKGRVTGVETVKFSRLGSNDEETLRSFICLYYGGSHYIPVEILLPARLPEMKALQRYILEQRQSKVRILSPGRGKGAELVRMAADNAAESLSEWESFEGAAAARLQYIAGRLHLPNLPERIECIDISHTSGREVVGAVVVMESGELKKSQYRKFKVKADAKGDDFIAMTEVISRRLARGVKGERKWKLPDLLLIDGGRGHLKVASILKDDFGLEEMSVAAIAKDRKREEKSLVRRRVKEKILAEDGIPESPADGMDGGQSKAMPKGGFDTIYVDGHKEGIPATGSTPLGLLVRLRDEAHRFAIGYHRKLRGKKALASDLLEVKGIGPAMLTRIFDAFKGPGALRAADAKDISEKAGIGLKTAERIKEKLDQS
ncbi:MAG: excinuclease ABC subunit UvrC [Pseudomonadota bacterium]